MRTDGANRGKIVEALVDAFDEPELRALARRIELDQVLPGHVAQRELAWALVEAAERRGVLQDLLEEAVAERPGRHDLRARFGLEPAEQRPVTNRPADLLVRWLRSVEAARSAFLTWAANRGRPRLHSSIELAAWTRTLFLRADRRWDREQAGARTDNGIIGIAENVPASLTDVSMLAGMLSAHERGYFAYRGELPPRVEEQLNRLRLQGHPVIPMPAELIANAIQDGADACSRLLQTLESQYVGHQNLFEQKNALIDSHFFFGRQELLTSIGDSLARGDAVLLTGLRKSGKSSVLNVIRQHMPGRPWCHVDLQQFSRDAAWPVEVFRGVISAYDRWAVTQFPGWESTPPPTDGASFVRALQQCRERELAQSSTYTRPVLVLDEGERVFPRKENECAQMVLAGALRAATQSGERLLSILMADLRPHWSDVNVLPSGDTNPFYNYFRVVPVGLFSREDVADMTRTIGAAMGVRQVEDDLVERIHAYTGGHPFLSRRLAAWAHEKRTDPASLTLRDLDLGMKGVARRAALQRFFAQNLWAPMREMERAIVLALATSDESFNADEHDMEALAELLAQGVIRTEDEETFSLTMTGFRRWLIAEQRRMERRSA